MAVNTRKLYQILSLPVIDLMSFDRRDVKHTFYKASFPNVGLVFFSKLGPKKLP
jgi:hypothetical protein